MKKFWKFVLGAFIGSLIALLVLFFITLGMIGSLASLGGDDEAKAPAAGTILKITGVVEEQSGENMAINPLSMNMDMSKSLGIYKAVSAIDAAAEDPSVKMIYIDADNFASSISNGEEVREALSRFRESGKPVIAYSDNLTIGNYYLASVADKVVLNAFGEVVFNGLSSNIMFYKDIIDKLGIDIQLIRHGKYKSAGEPFIKNDISPENREQYECMLGTIWDTLVEGICASRDFSAEQFNAWVDDLKIVDNKAALEMGIVDELWYKDEMEDYLCQLCEVETADKLKVMDLASYAAFKVKPELRAKDKIAVIYADGQMMMEDGSDGMIGENFAREIAKVRKDSTVKAVVFRVNSPGGAVQAAAVIAREIALLQESKPVVASFGDYAASGGYWVSCQCDKIFSDKSTLTGSIGVFGIVPSFGRAIKKNLYINTVEVSNSKHGSLMDGLHPLDDEEVAYMQHGIENVYAEFTGRVAEGRGMTVEAVDDIAQGRVWAGGNALEIGLVDEIGSLHTAIEYAAAAANLEKYQIAEYPAPKSTMEKLMEIFQGGVSVKVDAPEAVSSAAEDLLWLESLDRPVIMARMDNICIK